jgi:uncharacterized protein (TIGR03083 family)
MHTVQPLFTVDLFPVLHMRQMQVLHSLPPEAWDLPTACAGWSVKDVALHLLAGSMNRLSQGRDGGPPLRNFRDVKDNAGLVAAINEANAEWVTAAQQIPVPLIIDQLAINDAELYEYFASLPPFGQNGPAVAWAGDTHSPNWFDIAREYTEKWLHQQHIREAVGQPVLAERRFLHPVLDTFMRALPHTYRAVEAADGTALTIEITGEAGGAWSLLREAGWWRLYSGATPEPAATARLDQDTAWRLFTRGMSAEAAGERLVVEGDAALGRRVLRMVAIMA